ncbi:MAG: hypothetical protein A3F33_03495 [Candidatus Woykebacteria bacterium RIFCSPHIGHO2_12_FULL_43_10]|nr:MAG: hypothetical protein A3F33_03495 [Candidatus Woykebacteria bacterium RIFCSPHIGHO2_12_FULL_43_10]
MDKKETPPQDSEQLGTNEVKPAPPVLENDPLIKTKLIDQLKKPWFKTFTKKQKILFGLGTTVAIVVTYLLVFPTFNSSGSPILSISNNILQKFTPDPKIDWPNNKFGIYSYRDHTSIEYGAELVNSSGGDWGWILFPMNIKEKDQVNWNSTFKLLSEKHLIPIIQIVLDPGTTPNDKDIDSIATFLDKLEWPTKQRFISAFNEVNAAEYWGNKIDPEGHAQVLDKLISTLKGKSKNFFITNGAFNASARTGKVKTDLGVQTEYLDMRDFLTRMEAKVPGIFKKLDGWAAHTYPHPFYKGKATDTSIEGESEDEKGRNTMSSYKWELNFLKEKFGVELPVFITETGWPHREGTKVRSEWLDQFTVASYYKSVFNDIYLPDERVIAVTPFGIQINTLDNFSFVSKSGKKFPQFETIKNLPKTKGQPPLK